MRQWRRQAGLLVAFALLSGCATGAGMGRAELRASLTGLQEVPGPGDPDGGGTAVVRVNPAGSELCWTLAVRGIEPATAAHIHRGAEGSSGPPVVTLTVPGVDGQNEGCISLAQTLAAEIANRPFDFYVNVHNGPFPAGAIRGQLRGDVGRLRER